MAWTAVKWQDLSALKRSGVPTRPPPMTLRFKRRDVELSAFRGAAGRRFGSVVVDVDLGVVDKSLHRAVFLELVVRLRKAVRSSRAPFVPPWSELHSNSRTVIRGC